MVSSQRPIQRQLMKKYNICFDGPIDSIRNPRWPSNCDPIFQHIRQLGKIDFEHYRDSISADVHHHPWREQVQRRASRVADIAKLCLEGRKNEGGWRLALEPEIMARLTVEVACQKCRGRLWRSEQEVVSSNSQNETSANSLGARQMRRQPCKCDPSGYVDSVRDQGINPLFDDRVDEGIVYPPELQRDLPSREDRPDRVYGLRVTSRLERLLLNAEENPIASKANSTNDGLRSSPFKVDGDPIVYPFLIIEAKSEKGADSFTDIQVQTAFAIRELLSLQEELAQAAGEGTEWDGGPLVWFLSYKGELWRVWAAYIETEGEKKCYRVVRLWEGGLDSPENALQLLLIIDYIVDWARDIYREGVARSLKKLALHDSKSLAYDSDIFSLAEDVQDWVVADDEGDEVDLVEPQSAAGDLLRAFDSQHGVFRDARFIRTRFIGLYVTEENFRHLIYSAPSNDAAKKLAKSLLESLEESCRMRRDMLDDLEVSWTDMDRHGADMIAPDAIFLVVATAVSYFTPDWEQTRELSYLAIADTVIDRLFKIADVKRPLSLASSRIPLVTSMSSFREVLKRSAADNLSACASRLCIYTGHFSTIANCSSTSWVWKSLPSEQPNNGKRSQREMVVKVGPRSKAREFVYALYLKHRVGRNEPTSPIFRLSTRLDELAPPQELSKRPELLSEDVWHCINLIPSLRNQGLIFALSEQPDRATRKTDICVFVMDPSIVTGGLLPLEILRRPGWHMRVKRFDNRPGWDRGWNLKGIESSDKTITTKIDQFVKHLRNAEHRQSTHDLFKSKKKTKWEVLTDGVRLFNGLAKFEFDTDVPYRRHTWREATEVPHLPVLDTTKKESPHLTVWDATKKESQPEYIVIDDEDDDSHKDQRADKDKPITPISSQATTNSQKSLWLSRPELRPGVGGNLEQQTHDARNIARIPSPKRKQDLLDEREDPRRKRVRETGQENDEAGTSAEGARRGFKRTLSVAEQTFERDFLGDEEYERVIQGKSLP
ncbi:hypothetical protein BGZ61DRAFT_457118 [Ilyonectria robusta]|uniref:uncharacterized protein n=1 Tax=Ilyonectria robusta TaxID=1079257 RepID=UPI001E8E574C|nr:uncharacterized protein BGZ61DRAFT_457118 [Ilyonectria robusta]KAH8679385.1 hypothetical protein BGZ61DRAFT_457118 [Ilyonectria robusta]